MGYVKVVKNKNYYKRYKVKMRRRRENKTNYRLRRGLIRQDKRKYNVPKWRFIVRITNTDVICQVACAKMIGDQIICAAYSHELKRYGLKVGLTNYAACYCTGLLLARRLLKKLKLDKFYPGKKVIDGNKFRSHIANVKFPDDKMYRPFKCLLDVGLARCTTGARIFGALKGAVDGGLDIPHSEKRFPGFKKGQKDEKDEYDAAKHSEKIFGGHIRDHMNLLKEKDVERYNKHFSQYVKLGINADDLDELYRKVHREIRKDPSAPPKVKKDYKKMKLFPEKQKKLSGEERKQRRMEKIKNLIEAKDKAEKEKEMKQDQPDVQMTNE